MYSAYTKLHSFEDKIHLYFTDITCNHKLFASMEPIKVSSDIRYIKTMMRGENRIQSK